MGFWMAAARGLDGGFQPGFASRSAAGGLPGLMMAVLAVGSGVVEAFCARLRHRQLPFGVLDSESGRARGGNIRRVLSVENTNARMARRQGPS